jgi:hypothetical protein
MRGVCNDAYLNYKAGVGYEKNDILNLGFFTEGDRLDSLIGEIKDGNLTFNIPSYGALPTGTSVYAYVGLNRITAVYNGEKGEFSALVGDAYSEGKEYYVTIFSSSGRAFSGKVKVEEQIKGFLINLDLNYDIKLRYDKIEPNEEWSITQIDNNFYYLHVKCAIIGQQEQSITIKNLNELKLPSVEIISPNTNFVGMQEFSFGKKWRYYYTGGYIDFKIENGNIIKIIKFKDVQDLGNVITYEEVEEIFSQEKTVGGYKEITLKPYCIKSWS